MARSVTAKVPWATKNPPPTMVTVYSTPMNREFMAWKAPRNR